MVNNSLCLYHMKSYILLIVSIIIITILSFMFCLSSPVEGFLGGRGGKGGSRAGRGGGRGGDRGRGGMGRSGGGRGMGRGMRRGMGRGMGRASGRGMVGSGVGGQGVTRLGRRRGKPGLVNFKPGVQKIGRVRHRGRHHGRFDGGGSGRGGWSGGYLDRFRRRNDGWYGGNNSWYGRSVLYPYWNNFFSAPSWYDYWWSPPCECKRGCTPDGCAYPGNGVDDCVWATDCDCCDF